MKIVSTCVGVLALGSMAGMAQAAEPATTADVAVIQAELGALRTEYDARISDLEAKLKDAQAVAAPAGGGEAAAPAPVTTSANASNPGISVVLNGNYVAASHDTADAAILGYPLADEAGLPKRGPSLGESEITLAANVDPFLRANLTASFGGDSSVSVEEAFVQSTALPGGLTVKAGRFFSAIGYLNERHSHDWAFIDMPLPYRAMLGGQYGDDGVQLRWLAPTPIFLELGGEIYRGDAFPGANPGKNSTGAQTLFVHSGADINDSSSWLAGLSYLHAKAADRDTGGDLMTGNTSVGIASLVYKWAPGGNPVQRNFNLTTEYFVGQETGLFDNTPFKRQNSGWFAQGSYHFDQSWTAGLRYARLDAAYAPPLLAGSTLDGLGHAPSTVSGLLEFDTSEFARFRLQYNRDLADRRPNDELLFQYTTIFGPHGAHRY